MEGGPDCYRRSGPRVDISVLSSLHRPPGPIFVMCVRRFGGETNVSPLRFGGTAVNVRTAISRSFGGAPPSVLANGGVVAAALAVASVSVAPAATPCRAIRSALTQPLKVVALIPFAAPCAAYDGPLLRHASTCSARSPLACISFSWHPVIVRSSQNR